MTYIFSPQQVTQFYQAFIVFQAVIEVIREFCFRDGTITGLIKHSQIYTCWSSENLWFVIYCTQTLKTPESVIAQSTKNI